MIPLETTEVKASELKIGDAFFDEFGDIWRVKRIEDKPKGYLNLWFDNLEGTESFYPIRKDETLPKVVESATPEKTLESIPAELPGSSTHVKPIPQEWTPVIPMPLGSSPDPLNSDIDEPNYGDGIPESDKGGAVINKQGENTTPVDFWGDPKPEELVYPSEKQPDNTMIAVKDVRIRDRISCKHPTSGDTLELGVVASIRIGSDGHISFYFTDGNVEAFHDLLELVTLHERGCVIEASNHHVGTKTLTLRFDNDPDAQQAALTYAFAIQNSNPNLSEMIKSLTVN